MKVEAWLKLAKTQLDDCGIRTSRLDSLILLEAVTGKDRAWLLAHPDSLLNTQQLKRLKILLGRRTQHEPLAYIRGYTEFYGRNFVITPAVLEPRPESETMIDLLKSYVYPAIKAHFLSLPDSKSILIADVGTGSGALGITAKLELVDCDVDLLDISNSALEVAKRNVDLFTLNISTIKTNLLINAPHSYSILLCNLPYVPDDFKINLAALKEPRLAIFGGPDGMAVYRNLFNQIDNLFKKPLYILCESMPPQHSILQILAESSGYTLEKTEDFIQVFSLN